MMPLIMDAYEGTAILTVLLYRIASLELAGICLKYRSRAKVLTHVITLGCNGALGEK